MLPLPEVPVFSGWPGERRPALTLHKQEKKKDQKMSECKNHVMTIALYDRRRDFPKITRRCESCSEEAITYGHVKGGPVTRSRERHMQDVSRTAGAAE